MTSITKTVTVSLSVAALAIFLAAIVIVVWLDFVGEPNATQCEAAGDIVRRATEIDPVRGLTTRSTDDIDELRAGSPSLWYVISYDRFMVEFAPDQRPQLPFALPYTGPIGRSYVKAADEKNTFCVDVVPQGASELVVLVGNARIDFAAFMKAFVERNSTPVAMIAVAFAAIVAAGAFLSAQFVSSSIARVTRLALSIEPTAPQASIPLDDVPLELKQLVSALNRAFGEIDAYVQRQRRFLGNAAHELRTPLTLLRAKIDDVTEPALRAELVRDVRRLTSLVAAMLDLARLQNHTIEKHAIDLSALARDVLADFTPSALDAGVELSLEQVQQGSVMVHGVEAAIRSALANLVGNALIHAHGAKRIVADVERGSVSISDDGVGISPASDPKLIEPFQKGDAAKQGAGLGLSIVQEIMVAHGGSLTIRSTPGRGTTACLRFPEAFAPMPG